MNLEFKAAMTRSGRKHYELAKVINGGPSKISRIINETYTPTEKEKLLLAQAIGVSVEDVFRKQSTVAAK